MNLQKAINKRHSIREYEEKTVSKELLKQLIINATKAPSASNRQPWKFYCVYSKNKRDIISIYLKEASEFFEKDLALKPLKLQAIMHQFNKNMGNCPHVIFIFREKIKKESEHIKPNDISSISCAAENLMLSAYAKGLGTCWIGSFKLPIIENKIKRRLDIPFNQELIASILIGYPKKGYKPLIRSKKKLNQILEFK